MQHKYYRSGSCRSNLLLEATICSGCYVVGCKATFVSCMEAQCLRLQMRA